MISKQISDRYPFTVNADQTEIQFKMNQNATGNNMAIDPSENVHKNRPIVVVVHGVGQQARFDTLRSFLDGWCRAFNIPFSLSRASLASRVAKPDADGVRNRTENDDIRTQENDNVIDNLETLPFGLIEYNYSKSIDDHTDLLEYSPKRWVQSWRSRLKEIDSQRQEGKADEFSIIDSTVDDVSLAVFLSKTIADRARIQTNVIEHGATHFLQQVQLYIDYPSYRNQINSDLVKMLDRLEHSDEHKDRPLIFVAHSLGTVVAYSTIVEAVSSEKPWAKRITNLFTFGSPLDTLKLLFPELVKLPEKGSQVPIRWINYCLGNDPIATDLAIVRSSLKKCPEVFDADAPEEVYLGSGGPLTAHTDYWINDKMMRDIKMVAFCDGVTTASSEAKPNSFSSTLTPSLHKSLVGTLLLSSLLLSLASAWFIVVWWEENLKGSDADRATLLEPPQVQIVGCLLLFLCIVSHVFSWSLDKLRRWFAFFISLVVCIYTIIYLPQLANCLMTLPEDTTREKIAPVIQTSKDIPFKTNLLLLLIPASAFCGATRLGRSDFRKSLKKPWIVILSIIVVSLTMFVGRRDNPSNASAEIALLVLILVTWWLAILFSRISYFLSSYVMGRKHLDTLSARWRTESSCRPTRKPY